jgi:hypothetical protein
MNHAAQQDLPWFIVTPGALDWLMVVMLLFLIIFAFSFGLLYLNLHHLPERRAHGKVQMQIVAVLGLLAMFTHNNIFWIAALLLALVRLPNFSMPLNSIALSLEKLSLRDRFQHKRGEEPNDHGRGTDLANLLPANKEARGDNRRGEMADCTDNALTETGPRAPWSGVAPQER